MSKHRFAALFAGLFLVGMVLGGIRFFLHRPDKTDYLPKAKNDFIMTTIGDGKQADSSQRSVEAHTQQESYPQGTEKIVLVITNRSENDLIYTGYYDFRRVDGDTVTPLSVREDVAFDLEEHVLKSGETVTQTVAIDLFEEPLNPGTYRASQLACFRDTQEEALACSEITSDFIIE